MSIFSNPALFIDFYLKFTCIFILLLDNRLEFLRAALLRDDNGTQISQEDEPHDKQDAGPHDGWPRFLSPSVLFCHAVFATPGRFTAAPAGNMVIGIMMQQPPTWSLYRINSVPRTFFAFRRLVCQAGQGLLSDTRGKFTRRDKECRREGSLSICIQPTARNSS